MYAKRLTPIQLAQSWRLGNGIMLVLSLFLPWSVSWSDIFLDSAPIYSNGFSFLFLPKTLVRMRVFIEDYLPDRFLPQLGWSLLEAIVPITAIGYSVYRVITFFGHGPGGSGFRKKSILRLLTLILVAYPLWHISYGVGFNNKLSWGYYVAILGFISSALLELYSILLFRDQQRSVSVQPPEAG